ncbi:unnamed protein product [Debaryomyces tyrocola]|nr:unnamed protein product [Debaryomyces tyrocola]
MSVPQANSVFVTKIIFFYGIPQLAPNKAAKENKKLDSDTGSRTRVCSVKANRASRYTISDIVY